MKQKQDKRTQTVNRASVSYILRYDMKCTDKQVEKLMVNCPSKMLPTETYHQIAGRLKYAK